MYVHASNNLKTNVDGDYDSYSSEDENFKKMTKTNMMKLTSSINIPNSKNVIKNRSSAPILVEKISDFQKEHNQKISDKLYMPFIKDKLYKLEVNKKLTKIKEDSKNNAIFTQKLLKKKDEIEKIGKQLFIYNNPSKNYLFFY